jgi:hypothetical protein
LKNLLWHRNLKQQIVFVIVPLFVVAVVSPLFTHIMFVIPTPHSAFILRVNPAGIIMHTPFLSSLLAAFYFL